MNNKWMGRILSFWHTVCSLLTQTRAGSRPAHRDFVFLPGEQFIVLTEKEYHVKKFNFLIPITIIGAVFAGAYFFCRQYLPFYGGGYGGYHMGGGMGFIMPFFWILLVVAVVSLVGRTACTTGERDERRIPEVPDAMEILKQRYAKGEIDQTEFRAKQVDIRNT
jgi:putative membrane protein